MRFLYILAFLIIGISSQAQTTIESIQKEIDQTVWKPFQNAFETLDAEALNAIYYNDVLRVTPAGLDTDGSFKSGNLERFRTLKKANSSIRLDFWFDSRRTNETTSYEVGFYRIAFINATGTTYSYGQFHIVLEKTNGQWKITQDWDTTAIAGKTIDAALFEQQAPLRF